MISAAEWERRNRYIKEAKKTEGEKVVAFGVPGGGHFIRFYPDDGWKAIYAGPHGPECRPSRAPKRTIIELMQNCTDCEIISYDESPYNTLELRDL